ncbi:MAG: hypothetical protein RLZZ126_1127 [Pseudomonadota bacterium]|jgi:regulator of sigma E protease
MLTVFAFLVALGVLIAVHEYGHYRMAVACGVKVLRFSVGMGKPIYSWRREGVSTEFVLGMLPLGGYVKMLDGREAPVSPDQRHAAFDAQPLRSRALIVLAGPIANLILAVLLYAGIQVIGVDQPRAVLGSPVPGSMADRAGLRAGDLVLSVAVEEGAARDVRSFETLRWQITRSAMQARDVKLEVRRQGKGAGTATLMLPLSAIDRSQLDSGLFRSIGLLGPWTEPRLGEILPGGAAQEAGLKQDDLVLGVNGIRVLDGSQLRELILQGDPSEPARAADWDILRDGEKLRLQVSPRLEQIQGKPARRIGAYVGSPPEMVTVRLGPLEALWHGVVQTWEVSALTLDTLGKMLVGQASLKNLSGPLTIAEYAGKSAQVGMVSFLTFLALISVSLGVLNLLPVPVLDGGHLMYYLWEWATGKAVSDAWVDRLARGGVALLVAMMSVAMFNDVTRLLG